MFFITSTQMSHVDMTGDKSLFNEPLFYTFIRGFFTTNLRTCVLRLVVLKKPLTEMITLMPLPMCQRLWYGCWWSWDVTIHNLRTVAPCYGKLLALLVYLTWLRRTGVRDLSRSAFLRLRFTTRSAQGTLQYVAAPLLVPARGSSLRWLLDRVWAALISTHMYVIFSTYTRVTGSVTIHNLRTVAPRYGELLALLVHLTWDSLWSGAIDTKLEMGRWAMLRSSYRRICIVIKTASDFPVFVVAVHSVVAHNHS